MNILFISNDPGILEEGSAVRTRMRAYADEVEKLDGILHIILRSGRTELISEGSLSIHAISAGRLSMLWRLPRAAKKLIQEERIGVVSAQDPFEHGWIARAAMRGTSAKLHIQVHTDFLSEWFVDWNVRGPLRVRMPLLNLVRRCVAGPTLRHADGIRVVSNRIQESLLRAYGNTVPIPSVIPIAVSKTVPEPVSLPTRSFTFALLAIGRLEPEKRFEDLIMSVYMLRETHPTVGLCIAGDGRERARLQRMARSLGISEKVIFLGWRTDAYALLGSAQAFVQASAYEGYGITLIEAALAGVPIITTDVGIVSEVLRADEDVLVAPVGDSSAIAALSAKFSTDTALCRTLASSAQQRVQEHLAASDSSPKAVMSDITRLI